MSQKLKRLDHSHYQFSSCLRSQIEAYGHKTSKNATCKACQCSLLSTGCSRLNDDGTIKSIAGCAHIDRAAGQFGGENSRKRAKKYGAFGMPVALRSIEIAPCL